MNPFSLPAKVQKDLHYEETAANERPSKQQRLSSNLTVDGRHDSKVEHVKLEDEEADDKGPSQATARTDGQLNTASGTNNVQQHDGESSQPDHNLRDAAKSNHSSEKQLRQHDGELPGVLPVGPTQYFPWLARLDFRTPQGMVQYASASFGFHEIELFKKSFNKDENLPPITEKYYIVLDSDLLPPLVTKTRAECGFGDDKSVASRSLEERIYLDYVIEMAPGPQEPEKWIHLIRPRYVLPLGHLVVSNSKGDNATWTGYHVVMDITTPNKGLWAVYCKEAIRLGQEYNELCPDGFQHILGRKSVRGQYDLIQLAFRTHWVSDLPDARLSVLIGERMRARKYHVQPFFTVPKLGSLLNVVKTGWAGHEDGPSTSG
ncbi:hypothetical protein PG999_007373 [Apiospora kogelbergensis]|uniref:Uncharacterized protein n=1 Tax=Apiospora kogelbergensis TaxID=1337665 RepID=A0AAW0QY32_9PEZI